MKVKSVVVHIINKEQATKKTPNPRATILTSDKLFDTENATVKGFSEKLAMSYFDKKIKVLYKF